MSSTAKRVLLIVVGLVALILANSWRAERERQRYQKLIRGAAQPYMEESQRRISEMQQAENDAAIERAKKDMERYEKGKTATPVPQK